MDRIKRSLYMNHFTDYLRISIDCCYHEICILSINHSEHIDSICHRLLHTRSIGEKKKEKRHINAMLSSPLLFSIGSKLSHHSPYLKCGPSVWLVFVRNSFIVCGYAFVNTFELSNVKRAQNECVFIGKSMKNPNKID